jgi:phosphoesterase RecJ-like protein
MLNVADIAERFGGGGHECASGCSIDGPLSMAVAQIMREIRPASPDK